MTKRETNKNAKTTKATANNSAFSDLLRTYENAARHCDENADTEKAYTTALTDLATACAFSVLKKICGVGGTVTEQSKSKSTTDTTKTIRQLRQSLARDSHDLDRIAYANTHSTAVTFNDNGDTAIVITDNDLHAALDTLIEDTLGDGMDLMHDAVVAILNETDKAKERNGGTLPNDFMTTPFEIRRLKRKVWIKLDDSVGGWETVTTTSIQEIYRAVRRAINNSRAAQTDPRNGYMYLSDLATDPVTGIEEIVYRRIDKYSDVGSTVADYNGKEVAYTANECSINNIDTIVGTLNLTAKQAKILALHQRNGYGNKAIATYLGITENSVKGAMTEIRRKAANLGLIRGMTHNEIIELLDGLNDRK